MRVLLVCGGGMSSSILAENLVLEATKMGHEDFYIEAIVTEVVKFCIKRNLVIKMPTGVPTSVINSKILI